MPDVTVTRTTNLQGRDLQSAVQAMVAELAAQSPYSAVSLSQRWEGGSRIILEAGGHMNGAVDIQSGSPSRVTAQINLLSGMARMYRDRVIRDINAIADRRLGGTPVASAAAPAAQPAAYAPPATSSPRREYDSAAAEEITSGIFGSLQALASGFLENFRTERPPSVLDQYQLPSLPTLPPVPGSATTGVSVPSTPAPTVPSAPSATPAGAEAKAPTPGYVDYTEHYGASEPKAATTTQTREQEAFPWGWVLVGAGALVGSLVLVKVVSRGRGD